MAQPTIAQLESRIHQLEQALHQQLTHHEQLCRIVLHLQERLIVRNDAAGEGITSRELVEEARRVAHSYVAGGSRFGRAWRSLNPMAYTLMGAGAIGLAWLAVTLI